MTPAAAARALSTLVLVVAVAALATLVLGETTGRWRVLPIRSGSMTPALPHGALALATPLPVSRIAAGDIIVFREPVGDHRPLAHRVVRVVQGGSAPVVLTKGDANAGDDPWRLRVQGRTVWAVRGDVPLVGYLALDAHSLAPPILLVIGLAILARPLGRRLYRPYPALRRRHRHAHVAH